MKSEKIYKPRLLKVMLYCLIFLAPYISSAQNIMTLFSSHLLHDTLVAENNKDFLYNNLTITNTSSDKINLTVSINAPKGWQLITGNFFTLTLSANENTIIPMRLLPGGSTSADWQEVKIEYHLDNSTLTRTDVVAVKVKEFTKFNAQLPNSNMVLTSYQRNVSIPVSVKNSGNKAQIYTINYHNDFLHLDGNATIQIPAATDTLYYVRLALNDAEWKLLTKEEIKISVSDSTDAMSLMQSLSKVGYSLKEHRSAYMDMPLQLEAGAVYQGENLPLQYYGALYGRLDFSPKEKFSFSLRSNTIAKGQTSHNGIIRADYAGEHWYGSAGTIMELNDFAMDGYGAKVGYAWSPDETGRKNSVDVFAVLKSRVGDTKTFGGNFRHKLSKKSRISEALTANNDNMRHVNGGILNQKVEVELNTASKLSIVSGVGLEQSTAISGAPILLGSSLGYNLNWSIPHLTVISNVLYNSDNFPGIYKGQRLQSHDVRWVQERTFLGGYYDYNFKKQNYFYDTALFTGIYDLKTNNGGIRGGVNFHNSNITLSLGNQRQTQAVDSNTTRTNFNYANLLATVFFAKKIFLTINSYAGQNSIIGGNPADKIWITSNQGTLQAYVFGMSFRYDRGPFYYHEYVAYVKNHEPYERILLCPYVDLSLFKSSLNIRAMYNFAQSQPNQTTSSTALLNLSYNSPVHGFDIQLNGVVPLTGTLVAAQPYISLSARMRLTAPFLPVKKYHKVRMILFKDANADGIMNDGEEPVIGQTLSLNGTMLVSDKRGMVELRNAEDKDYDVNYGFASSLKGWIPNSGARQKFTAKGETLIYVPFKVSRVLQGKLSLVVDSSSSMKFSLANIKVSATDTGTTVYSTITNEDGEFYLNVPAGHYVVTLSEAAFDENFRPTQLSQRADLESNNVKNLYFEVRQRKRQIHIMKED